MLYIESELAKRRQGLDGHSPNIKDPSSKPIATTAAATAEETSSTNLQQARMAPRQAATLGKLHEVDLGPETKLQNISRTEAAARKLVGDDNVSADSPQSPSERKDGKNWRGRKRRTSEDIRRDQLVEEVLRESRRGFPFSLILLFPSNISRMYTNVFTVDVYDEPDAAMPNENDLAADDRIAEQFRRDFMDAIRSRRRKTRAAPKGAAAGKKTETARGPKLGGSRSARAAMRQKQAQQK